MELICDREEVLRYLGYRGQVMSPEMSEMIERTMREAEQIVEPRHCFFEFSASERENGILIKENGLLLLGESIKKHLANCDRIILFAATLGVEIERRLHIYETCDMTKAVILDCCGSALIETYSDIICDEIASRMAEKNLYLTTRFSPGYGDLPLSMQRDFLRVTNAQRQIGLTCNEQFLMFPRKSVTAIIGITSVQPKSCAGERCDTCSMNTTCTVKRQ